MALPQMTLPFDEFVDRKPVNDNEPRNENEAKFRRFHAANPHVYDLLEKFAFKAIAAGREHYGVKALFEIIRWHTSIHTTDNAFKLSNTHAPYYARLFHKNNPKHAGFFITHAVQGE